MATNEEREDQTVSGATKGGFAGGFLGALQNRFLAATGRGNLAPVKSSWQENNEAVVTVNARIMEATAERITLLGYEVQTWKGSLVGSHTLRLLDERAQAVEDLRAMQESMAHDQVNVDVQDEAHTDADVQERRQRLSQLQGANDQLRAKQHERGPVRESKFVKGYMALTQSRMFGDFEPGQHGENPAWRENTRKAGSANRQFMQDSATTLTLLERDIAATDPWDSAAHLVGLHADVTGARAAVAEMISEDEHTKNAQAWGWTDDQLAAQGKLVRGLHRITESLPSQRQLRASQTPPKAAEVAPEGVVLRGIESQVAARQPGVEPAAGLAAGRAALTRSADAVQRTAQRRAAAGVAKSAGRAVVMNPQHAAGLQDLVERQGDSLEGGDGGYDR